MLYDIIYVGGGLVSKSCPILATPWTVARQAPLSVGFSRQEYWSGLPFPSPGDLPDPGIKSESPALQGNSLLTEVIHGIYKLKQVSECNSQEHLLHFSKRQQACWSVSGFYLFFISVFCPILCDLNSQRTPAPRSRRAES